MATVTDIRPSPIAGLWYPGSAPDLRALVDEYLRSADVEPPRGQVIGVMAPHAGYRYSGPVAAYAFKLLEGMDADVVAVVSPMHHPYLSPVLTTGHQAYRTPLGVVPVNRDLLSALAKRVKMEPVRMDQEHSLEIELPFLQRVLAGDFTLIPIMLRDQSPETARELGHALAEVLRGQRAVLVASTDLSHYYNQATANVLDKAFLEGVAAFDPDGLFEIERRGRGFACGLGAVAAVMWASKELGADRAEVVRYATSGDVTGDYSQVVGYGAAAFYRSEE